MKVLIADDNDNLRSDMVYVVREICQNATIIEVANFRDAMNQLDKNDNKFDLFIFDVRLDGDDPKFAYQGMLIAQKATTNNPNSTIILVSAFHGSQSQRKDDKFFILDKGVGYLDTLHNICMEVFDSFERKNHPLKKFSNKRTINFFVSYAHVDNDLKVRLLKQLKQYLDIAKGYDLTVWQDTDIVVGTNWREQIQVAIDNCDYGLLLVSPTFLHRNYIQENELPLLVEKGAIPIALRPHLFTDNIDLRGLEHRQFFIYKNKSFQECRGNEQCNFAHELFQNIIKRIEAKNDI